MIKNITLQHKIKSYVPIMEYIPIDGKYQNFIRKLKTYAPLIELRTEAIKKQRKKIIIKFNQQMQ